MQFIYKKPFNGFYVSILFVGIFLVAITLRFFRLDHALGGGDENAMLLYFGYRPLSYIVSHYHEASNHIFHSILVHFMAVLFGEDNEIAIRFPSFFFGLASLWLIYCVANLLFQSTKVALTSLFVAAINPTHIYYSQTARGYSLMMFFSIAMIFSCLKVLEGKKQKIHGFVFIFTGFLSIYTLPTNIYFIFGLAGWVLVVLSLPKLRNEFNFSEDRIRKIKKVFIVFFVVIGCLAIVAFLPIFEQMVNVSKYDIRYSQDLYGVENNSFLLGIKTIGPLLLLIFKGSLQWFIPFLVMGIFFFPAIPRFAKALPICLLALPVFPVFFTGISGYPRNYLYNFPILIIFLSAGLLLGGQWFGEKFSRHSKLGCFSYAFLFLYVLVSLKVLFVDYYPSVSLFDGHRYKKSIKRQTQATDLILVSNTRNYLYARGIYRQNLQNILREGKLSGLKMVIKNQEDIKAYKIPRGTKPMHPFASGKKAENWTVKPLKGSLKLASVNASSTTSLLPDNFAASAQWKLVSGKGQIEKENSNALFNGEALRLTTKPHSEMVLFATFPKLVVVERESFFVFTWAGRNAGSSMKINQPELAALKINPKTARPEFTQILTGEANDGMNIHLNNTDRWIDLPWLLYPNLGYLEPGVYSLSIFLKVPSESRVWYDGFRAFLVSPS